MSLTNSVSGVVPTVGTQPTAAVNPTNTRQGARAAAKTSRPKQDSVHISAQAQAKVLQQSGQTPAQIAVALNTNVKTVDGYLGITAAVNATTTKTIMAATSPASPTATTPFSGKVNIKV
jgi:DNA-binding CsgD family transcriptional regulator